MGQISTELRDSEHLGIRARDGEHYGSNPSPKTRVTSLEVTDISISAPRYFISLLHLTISHLSNWYIPTFSLRIFPLQ